jgi:Zn-dependent protease with chaperone function
MKRWVAVLLMALLTAPQLLQAAITTPELPDPGTVPGVTREQQIQVGLKAMNEVYRQMPVLPDSSPVTQYVRQLGARLVAVIPQQYSWPYEFHVLQEKDINAFALPGGPIFVNLGTITAAANEAQLAGVLAHEMSHIYMQHSMKQQRKAALPSLLGGLAAAAGGIVGGPIGALGQVGAQVVAGSIIMKYSRTDEAQADAVGAVIMYKAGYNPQAMADFFHKLEEESGSGPPQFLSDHPNPGNRFAAITKEIQNWPPKQWRGDTPQFQQAQAEASNLKAYTAQEIQQRAKSGGWNNQPPVRDVTDASSSGRSADHTTSSQPAAPTAPVPVNVSGNFKTLERSGYTLQYPDNWQPVTGSQTAVTIAPEGGVSQNAIAYGVMVDEFSPSNPNAPSSQQMKELIQAIREQNPDVRTVGSPQRVTVNGVVGQSVDLLGNSPVNGSNGRGLPERDWLVSLPRPDGSLLYLVFIAPDRDFAKLRPSFEKMLRSLRLQ